MANETTTSSIAGLIPSIVAEAMFHAQEASIMRNLVKNYTVPFGSGKTVDVPIYGNVSAAGVAEGTDLDNTAVSAAAATLTVSEAGIMTTVTDLARRSSSTNVIADVGGLFGRAIAEKMDSDLIALFAALNGGTQIGDGIAVLTADDIFKAAATIRGNKVTSRLAGVISPAMAYDLKNDLVTNLNPSDAANAALSAGYVGTIAGVDMYESALATTGAVFARDAMGLAVMTDIGIETQRDASLRADEVVATATYGVGELFDAHGVSFNVGTTL